MKTITTTHEEKSHEAFYDVKTVKETGQEKVIHIYGFPQNIHIQEVKSRQLKHILGT